MPNPALPLFHLYGDPPDDQAFDFVHIETISSRSAIHDWTIRAHRHRNLFQILLIVRGGGEMTFEAQALAFEAPAAVMVPATIAHGFHFRPQETEGWVLSFTEDVVRALSEPLSKVDKVTIVSTGNGDAAGSYKLTGDVTKIAAQVPALFEALSGMQMSELLGKVRLIGEKAPKPVEPPAAKS